MPKKPQQLEFVDFDWERARSGYQLVRMPPPPPPPNSSATYNYIGALLNQSQFVDAIQSKNNDLESYTPDPRQGVHRQFAALPDCSEAFLAFVNEWGLPRERAGQVMLISELKELRARLSRLLDAVEAANNGKGPKRRKLQSDVISAFARTPPRLTMILTLKSEPGERDLRRGGQMALKVRPLSLFDYMLLQTIDEVRGVAQFKTCKGCGVPFRIGPGFARSDAEACSETCRKRIYRNKQKKELGHAPQG